MVNNCKPGDAHHAAHRKVTLGKRFWDLEMATGIHVIDGPCQIGKNFCYGQARNMAHVTLDFFLAADCDLSTWSCTNLVWPMAWASNSKSNCPSWLHWLFFSWNCHGWHSHSLGCWNLLRFQHLLQLGKYHGALHSLWPLHWWKEPLGCLQFHLAPHGRLVPPKPNSHCTPSAFGRPWL